MCIAMKPLAKYLNRLTLYHGFKRFANDFSLPIVSRCSGELAKGAQGAEGLADEVGSIDFAEGEGLLLERIRELPHNTAAHSQRDLLRSAGGAFSDICGLQISRFTSGVCRPVLAENSPLESFPGARTQ
jgi:hypothetical protein